MQFSTAEILARFADKLHSRYCKENEKSENIPSYGGIEFGAKLMGELKTVTMLDV